MEFIKSRRRRFLLVAGVLYQLLLEASGQHIWNHPSVSSSSYSSAAEKLSGGCLNGACTTKDQCSPFTHIATKATGECAQRRPYNEWVCCERKEPDSTRYTYSYEGMDSGGRTAVPVVTGPPSFGSRTNSNWGATRATDPKRPWNTATGCASGTCMKREECTSFDSVALPATGSCAGNRPGSWVCCLARRQETDAVSSAYSGRVNSATTEANYVILPAGSRQPLNPGSSNAAYIRGSSGSQPLVYPLEDNREPVITEGKSFGYGEGDSSRVPVNTESNSVVHPDEAGRRHGGNLAASDKLLHYGAPAAYDYESNSRWGSPDEEYVDSVHNRDDVDYGYGGPALTSGPALFHGGVNDYDDVWPSETTGRPIWESPSGENRRTEIHQGGGCGSGRCIKRKDCSSWDSVALEAKGACRRRTGGDWVCCARRNNVHSATTARPSTSTAGGGGWRDSTIRRTSTRTTVAAPGSGYDAWSPSGTNKHEWSADYDDYSSSTEVHQGGGCGSGRCIKRKDCSSWDSVVLQAKGACRKRTGGDWVCCHRKDKVTTVRPDTDGRWGHTTTTAYSVTRRPPTATTTRRNDYDSRNPSSTHKHEWSADYDDYGSSTEVHQGRGCGSGRCIKRKDCSSWDSVVLEAKGACRKRTGGDWVCCHRKDKVYSSTTVRPRDSTTFSSERWRHSTTTYSTGRRTTTESSAWRKTTPAPSNVSVEKQKKKDGCIAGECMRREDCDTRDSVVLNPTGICRKRTQGNWICCLRNKTEGRNPSDFGTVTVRATSRPTTTTTRGYNRQPVYDPGSNRRTTTGRPHHHNQAVCGIREGVSSDESGRNRASRYQDGRRDTIDLREPGRTAPITSRIVGGKEAEPYSWPWMAALFKETTPGAKRFLCAGSLVSDRYILSAAHVFTGSDLRDASSFVVTLGTHTGSDSIVEYRVRSIIQHPEYRNRYHYNDIALLELEASVNYNQYILPVCLPSSDKYCEDSQLVGLNATVTGWGDDAFGGKSSDVLKEATFPIVSRETCNASYVQVAASRFPRGITDEMLCAGSPTGGKDACQGDSGGPLTIQEGRNWLQVGIVSFGYQCGDPKYPGVYTKVSRYVDWIRSTAGMHTG